MTTTYLSDTISYDKSREFLEYPVEKQRFLFYKGSIYDFRVLKVIETETSVYWIEDKYKPRFTNKLFYTSKADTGITLDKKTKDVKIWFGKYPNEKLIDSFFTYHNVNPREVMSEMFRRYFTKSLAKDIAKGKIKNVDDYALFLSKRTIFFRGVDSKQLAKLIYHDRMTGNSAMQLNYVADILRVAKNIEETIDYLIDTGLDKHYWNIADLAKSAMALNEKVDFSSGLIINQELKRLAVLNEKANLEYRGKEVDDIPF